jgi:tetratricopeptide (TPR) repeat protein
MSPTGPAKHSRSRLLDSAPLGFCAVIIVAVLVYLPSLAAKFVWDDTALVLRDPLIRSWRLASEAFDHFLFLDATGSDFYRPIQRLTYLVDYGYYAFNPWGYHLTSVVVHALAAGALFLLARTLIAQLSVERPAPMWPAFATAVIWAVHPLHTSAVTYISGRADPLAALFCFIGLTLGLRSVRNPLLNWREFVAGLCFLLSALSKELGLIGFLLWLITLAFAGATSRRVFVAVAISAGALGAYAFMRSGAQHLAPPVVAPSHLSERPALAAAALGEYSALVLAPTVLRMERGQARWPKSQQDSHNTIFQPPQAGMIAAGCAAAALIAAWLIHSIRQRHRAQALALTLSITSFFPVSNLITLNATVAEHWLYLPLAFLLIAGMLDFARWIERWRGPHPAWAALSLAVLVMWTLALAARTWMRQSDWKDQQVFLEKTIADGGGSARMFINRALESIRRDDRPAARADYERAEQLMPDQPLALLGLASLDFADGNFEESKARLSKVALESFHRPAALEMMAMVRRAEHSGDGLEEMNQALALRPNDWPLTRRKVKFLLADGKNKEAVNAIRDFVFEHPFRAETWQLLSQLMRDGGNLKAAEVAAQRAADRDVHLDQPPN